MKLPKLEVYDSKRHKHYQHGGLAQVNDDGTTEAWWDGSDREMPCDEELQLLVDAVDRGLGR